MRIKNDDYKELNQAQRKAVIFEEGALLVIASAGSGKTKTLIHRVAHLIDSGIDPREILFLTFTGKAANEMLTRAETLIGQKCRSVVGGTFHSFAAARLRHFGEFVGVNPGNRQVLSQKQDHGRPFQPLGQ